MRDFEVKEDIDELTQIKSDLICIGKLGKTSSYFASSLKWKWSPRITIKKFIKYKYSNIYIIFSAFYLLRDYRYVTIYLDLDQNKIDIESKIIYNREIKHLLFGNYTTSIIKNKIIQQVENFPKKNETYLFELCKKFNPELLILSKANYNYHPDTFFNF
jgi:hypothetical protein